MPAIGGIKEKEGASEREGGREEGAERNVASCDNVNINALLIYVIN